MIMTDKKSPYCYLCSIHNVTLHYSDAVNQQTNTRVGMLNNYNCWATVPVRSFVPIDSPNNIIIPCVVCGALPT